MTNQNLNTQNNSQSQTQILVNVLNNKKIVFEIDENSLPRSGKHSGLGIYAITGVKESEFKGRKYLWSLSRFGKSRDVAPENSIVKIVYTSGSRKRTLIKLVAYFVVKETNEFKEYELTNVSGYGEGEKYKLRVKNLVLIHDGVIDYTSLEAEMQNLGYAVSRNRKEDNIEAYWLLRTFEEILNKSVDDREKLIERLRYLVDSIENEKIRREISEILHKLGIF